MKIVCATDFTQRSQAAAQVAVDLARRTGGWVELVHVMKPGSGRHPGAEPPTPSFSRRRFARTSRRGWRRNATGSPPPAVPVTFHVCEGDVEAAVLARGREVQADLIVTGTPRAVGLAPASRRQRRRGDRSSSRSPDSGGSARGRGARSSFGRDKKLRVMVALDGRGASAGAVAFVSALRAHVPCDVTFLRLYWAVEEFERLGLTGPRDLFAPDADGGGRPRARAASGGRRSARRQG